MDSKTCLNRADNERNLTGVVLVGDALHSFPPDLGLGVNVAMCDALVLGEAFEDAAASCITEAGTSKPSISFVLRALKSYQEKNSRETRALIALARCGAPFQYPQLTMKRKFQKVLWSLNILLRVVLKKVTNGLSPKPALMLQMVSCPSFGVPRLSHLETVCFANLEDSLTSC